MEQPQTPSLPNLDFEVRKYLRERRKVYRDTNEKYREYQREYQRKYQRELYQKKKALKLAQSASVQL